MPDETTNSEPTAEAAQDLAAATKVPDNAVDVQDAGTLKKKIIVTVPRPNRRQVR